MGAALENIVGGPVGLTASADLSAKQHLFMKVSGALTVTVAGAGELTVGVLQNKPTSGQAASIAGVGSTVKVVAGAAVTAGAKITADSDGKAVTATDDGWMAGIALDTVTDAGDLLTVYLSPPSLGIDDDIS